MRPTAHLKHGIVDGLGEGRISLKAVHKHARPEVIALHKEVARLPASVPLQRCLICDIRIRITIPHRRGTCTHLVRMTNP